MIPKPSIQRIAYKAGIRQLSGLMYEETRGVLQLVLDELVKKVIVVAENARRRTCTEPDVRVALRSMGKFAAFADGIEVNRQVNVILPGSEEQTKGIRTMHIHRKVTSHCSRMGGHRRTIQKGGGIEDDIDQEGGFLEEDHELYQNDYPTENDFNDDESEFDQEGGGIKRRRKKGALAMRKIKFYQRQGGHCFVIPYATFNRAVNTIAAEYKSDFNFTRDARTLIQLTTERYLISLFESANMIAQSAGRETVFPRDLSVARKIMNKSI